ncbi:MAG TPA: glycerol-3-phosphate dehydrogenase [Pyrinomonadaceae bacterium]|jgi:glycerol-3-phosphate dehydrogenase
MARKIPADITTTVFDVIVIGAGINGAGVARDASMRGLKVLVLEKGDIGGGTTAWSTRLIHGGLRYLEHGEIGLVRESLREREHLFRIAPHLVRPLPMLVPIYARGRRGALTVRAGMIAYDLLSFDKSLARHRMLTREETLRRLPRLNADGLRGAALYYDAQVEFPERLALENVLSAREHGASVLTYARVERMTIADGKVEGVVFTDLLDGGVHTARARLVVNVAGPWVDSVHKATSGTLRRMIGGTKGSHIVVNAFEGAPREAVYAEAEADGRPFFIIPWNTRYLIGTTDTRYKGDLDAVEADETEVDYLVGETNRVFPSAQLSRASVVYTYAGVRPLPYVGERDERGITRRHFIHDHAPELPGLISIIGGKLTTYRHLSELTVDAIFKRLRRDAPPCLTAQRPLPGAAVADFDAFRVDFKAHNSLHANVSERLLRLYGVRAREVQAIASEDDALAETLSDETDAIGAEIVFSFRHEMAETLCDSLWRRTMIGMTSATVGIREAKVAADIAARHLAWDAARVTREVAAYLAYVKRFHPRATGGEN